MAPVLTKRYGVSDQYTVPQLEKAAQECGISMQYIPYAIALYRTKESNRTVKLYNINQDFLDILRNEISNCFFESYPYKTKDVIKLAKPRAWRGGRNTDAISNRIGKNSEY